MHVLVAGSSGLIGTDLLAKLSAEGHRVTSLVRRPPGENEVRWYPEQNVLSQNLFDAVDAIVHLGGESIAEGRWTAAKKKRIRDSRVISTTTLAKAAAQLEPRPQAFICASAIGFYGERGDELLDESSPPGEGFLSDVCQAWEAACKPAAEAGIRVVNVRIGVVMSGRGGALPKMLTPFRMGVGGIMGSGRQYWSWVGQQDIVAAFYHALTTDSLTGPVNAVAPNPVTNREFTKTLGSVLRRPTLFPMPGFMARVALGEMANDLILASARVKPAKLVESGFQFATPELKDALQAAVEGA